MFSTVHHNVKGSIAVIVAFIECLVFGLTLGGWPSLVYLIKQDGIFNYLCDDSYFDSGSNLLVNSSHELVPQNQKLCVQEESMYNLAYTIGNVLRFIAYLPTAYLIDNVGLKFTRTIACLFTMSGGLMLGLCNKDYPYLLISGCSLIGVSGSTFILSNLQIANVFPKSKATILSILGAAQAGAVTVYLLFKFLSDYASISWNTSFIIWGSSASFSLLPTFLLLPKVMASMTETNGVTDELITRNNSKTYQLDNKSDKEFNHKSKRQCHKNYNSIDNKGEISKKDDFMKSLLSFSFIIHCFSLVIYTTNIGLYNGSYNWWINETTDDENTISALTNLLGISSILKMIITPLGGMFMDYHMNKCKEENTDISRVGFIPLLLAAVGSTALVISTLFVNVWAVRISVLLFPFCQAAYLTCCFSYTRIRFPRDHFNRLMGVIHLVAIFEPLIQHALFRLLMTNEIAVRMILLVFVGISYLNSFHLLCHKEDIVH